MYNSQTENRCSQPQYKSADKTDSVSFLQRCIIFCTEVFRAYNAATNAESDGYIKKNYRYRVHNTDGIKAVDGFDKVPRDKIIRQII